MDVFLLEKGDKVLLLGEGNFSFTCELVRILKESCGFQDFSGFFSTCLEDEESSAITAENKALLEKEGVRVLYGVDATKLSQNKHLQNGNFRKVIFNFPHVGGKMKIHLNRLLLKEFFTCASDDGLLSHEGEILMSLCSGQGGTGAEKRQRRWDDTWQVTEMAAFGNFLLKRIENFPHTLFPSYVSTGFRSTIRSFHTEGALIHIFKKSNKALQEEIDSDEISNLHKFHTVNDIEVTSEYKNVILKNPFQNPESPQSYLYSIFAHCAEKFGVNVINDLPMSVNKVSTHIGPICFQNKKPRFLRKSLFEVLENVVEVIASGIVFNDISCMSQPLADCELLIHSKNIQEIVKESITIISNKFTATIEDITYCVYNSHECCSINIDKLCSYLYQVDSHQLWLGTCLNNIFIPLSIFPKQYDFDVSFGSDRTIDERTFRTILYRLPCGIISSIRLLSVFHPEEIQMIYYCYRITYVSYEYPLHRLRVIKYNYNVLCKTLEKFFKVNIR
ncbi:uncharacterized protein LOC106668326 isoform X2 [Cimex lectularius]|uniref:25S rRNA (uridine-N(3))-methyltransferase BMT5-like domain-containing protein n=1 Tax=Cimex lectularius TaxID=79782 RepID=A0A8I6RVM5_CIMLE|nr:uncharacterized protein LOC106668326 isoform X2 [Cimex lectularius]